MPRDLHSAKFLTARNGRRLFKKLAVVGVTSAYLIAQCGLRDSGGIVAWSPGERGAPPRVLWSSANSETRAPAWITDTGVFTILTVFKIAGDTSFADPGNWNDDANKIEAIGHGGKGSPGSGSTRGGPGGGAGAYATRPNIPLKANNDFPVTVQIGAAGSGAVPTQFNYQQALTARRVQAYHGGDATTTTIGTGATITNCIPNNALSAGVGATPGGNGGARPGSSTPPGAGGGGAGGPNGGGSVGGSASASQGGTGGAADNSTVAGPAGKTGNANGAVGNSGTQFDASHGCGTGGGGGGTTAGNLGGVGGNYGGGGAGNSGNSGAAQNGAAGLLVISWTPLAQGVLAKTLDGLTRSASGTVVWPEDTGALAQTLAGLTPSITGTAPETDGALARTLADLTRDLRGGVEAKGSTVQTLAGLTRDTDAGVEVKGSTAQILAGLTRSIAGVVLSPQAEGALTQTLSPITRAAAGAVEVKGAEAKQLAPVAITAAGTAPKTDGSLTQTLAGLTRALAGAVEAKAVTTRTLADLTRSAAGKVDVKGTEAKALAPATIVAAGKSETHGAANPVLAALSSTAPGKVSLSGQLERTLAGALLSSEAHIGNPPVEASLARTLQPLSGSAGGVLPVRGAAGPTLAPLGEVAEAVTPIAGRLAQALGGAILQASGIAPLSGQAAMALAPLQSVAAGAIELLGAGGADLAPLTIQSRGAVGLHPVYLGEATVTARGKVDVKGTEAGGLAAVQPGAAGRARWPRRSLADLAISAGCRAFGRRLRYIPGGIGEGIDIVAEFNEAYRSADPRTGVPLVGVIRALSVRRADLPTDPNQGDIIHLDDAVFRVTDPRNEGGGAWLLTLRRISSNEGSIRTWPLADLAIRAGRDTFGQPDILYRAGGTGPEISITAEFIENWQDADTRAGVEVAATHKVVALREDDLPAAPHQGDTFNIDGVLYRVAEPRNEGEGAWVCILRRA